MNTTNEISIEYIKASAKRTVSYLFSKWPWILGIAFLFGVIGIVYAWNQEPMYTAELTFAPENDKSSNMGMYAGLAAQFGIDLGGGGGGVFEGDNLAEFLKSKMLVEKALLSPIDNGGSKEILINYYTRVHELDKDWKNKPALQNLSLVQPENTSRVRDSIMNNIVDGIIKNLVIEKLDKKVNILVARMKDTDELFSKLFVEKIVTTGIQYYIDYRSKKSRENVEILQRQTDSVKSLLGSNIVSVAASNDLNVNPIRQIARANVQRRQVDMQANSQLYSELFKQLELSKIALRKETPLIQIIDRPRLPLEKKKLGRLKSGLIFSFIGAFLTIGYFSLRKIYLSS